MPSKHAIRTVALVAVGAILVTAGGADAARRIGPNGIRNNAIQSRHIQNGQVRAPDIRDNSVGTHKLRNGGVRTPDLANNSVTSAKIRDRGVATPDLANNSVTSPNIRDGQVTTTDLADNSVTSAKIRNGTIALADLSAAAINALRTTYAGPNWGIVDRSVIGNGDSYLRAGPSAPVVPAGTQPRPPRGIGSLGMRVGSAADKAVFGNQVDFLGRPLSSIVTLGYSTFTNGATAPNLQFEIDPNLGTNPTNFSTLTFENPGRTANGWESVDPTTGEGWGMTGAAGTATGCLQTPVSARCTWDEVKARLAADNDGTPAAILTVQLNIGTGAAATSAAVDGLRINNQVFDFEPFGVSVVAP